MVTLNKKTIISGILCLALVFTGLSPIAANDASAATKTKTTKSYVTKTYTRSSGKYIKKVVIYKKGNITVYAKTKKVKKVKVSYRGRTYTLLKKGKTFKATKALKAKMKNAAKI